MEGNSGNLLKRNHKNENCPLLGTRNEIGIVTGNWGCGAFGGDPELKAMIQWLAASQVLSLNSLLVCLSAFSSS